MTCASSVLWLQLNSVFPNSDTDSHITKSWDYYQILLSNDGLFSKVRRWYLFGTTFPPLPYILSAGAYWVNGGFGVRAWLTGSVLIFWPLMIVYTYRVGALLWNREAGLLAATLVSTSPFVLLIGRKFKPEVPQAALAVMCLYYLFKSDRFAHRWPSWIFGVCMGMALMIKWTMPVYIGGALIYVGALTLARSRREGWLWIPLMLVSGAFTVYAIAYTWRTTEINEKTGEGFGTLLASAALGAAAIFIVCGLLIKLFPQDAPEPWLRLLQSVALAWAIAGPWYITHMHTLQGYVPDVSYVAGTTEGDPTSDTLSGWLFYPLAIRYIQFSAFYYMFLIGMAWGIICALRGDDRAMPLVLTAIVFYAMFSAINNKEARYVVPVMPILALLTVYWLPALGRGRWLVTAPLVAICFVQLWGWSFVGPTYERVKFLYLSSDSVAASAMSLPGRPVDGEPIVWRHLWDNDVIPLLGARPQEGGWDDTTYKEDRGP